MNKDVSSSQNQYTFELDRARKELAILYEVSNAMRTTLDLKHILYIILTGVTAHTGLGFNRAVLFLINSLKRRLEPQMAIGPDTLEDAEGIWDFIQSADQNLDDLIQEEKLDQNIGQKTLFDSVKELKIPLSTTKDNLLISAFLDGLPMHITQETINDYAGDPLLNVFKTNELVIMPLKVKDQVNGLIIADNHVTQNPITDDDLKIFTMLANQAGLAIENSRLYELIKHKSHTDAITNLWNHGYFQDKLSEVIDKARKTRQTIGLMMIDIDNFKKLNDTYGHQNGDIVLKEIAHILRDSSRDGDFVCRYGGEEFSIILTQTDCNQAHAIAERIRERIAQFLFPQFSSDHQLRVTVSIGLALYPSEQINSKEALIDLADKAMYAAKHSGKNRTCTANDQ